MFVILRFALTNRPDAKYNEPDSEADSEALSLIKIRITEENK